jgi:hydroxyacylglutathione hydrolase
MENKVEELKPLTVEEVESLLGDPNVVFVDTRHADVFTEGFVPSSISLGLEGKMEEYAKKLLPAGNSIVIIADEGKEEESYNRLKTAGFTGIKGYLEGGYPAWVKAEKEIDIIISIEADEAGIDLSFDENIVVLDVRKQSEYEEGHIDFAVNLPLFDLADPATVSTIEDDDSLYIHCAGGYRSVIAASILKKHGLQNMRNIKGGWKALEQESRMQDKIVYPKKKSE